eukprot:141431-Amphidinium_carterae.1
MKSENDLHNAFENYQTCNHDRRHHLFQRQVNYESIGKYKFEEKDQRERERGEENDDRSQYSNYHAQPDDPRSVPWNHA